MATPQEFRFEDFSKNAATTSSSVHSNSGGSITVLNTIIGRDIAQAGTALSGSPPVARFTNSPVILTNIRTLEKRYTRIDLVGRATVTQLPMDDDYVVEINAKRAGVSTPNIFSFD